MLRFSTLPLTDYRIWMVAPIMQRFPDGKAQMIPGTELVFKKGILELDETTPAGYAMIEALTKIKEFGTDIKYAPIPEETIVNGRKAWLEPLTLEEMLKAGPPKRVVPPPPVDDFDAEPKERAVLFEKPAVEEAPKQNIIQGAVSSGTMALKGSKPPVR